MLKDDRMMGMLTFVVIMLALGTFIQRADLFQRLMGPDGPPAELVLDEATTRAAEAAVIDVLANDVNIGSGDAAKLAIVAAPECGRAFVQDGRIHYLGGEDCVGAQTLRYALGGERTAAVRISVEPSPGPSQDTTTPGEAAPREPSGLRAGVRIGSLGGSGTTDAVPGTDQTGTQARAAGPETAGTPLQQAGQGAMGDPPGNALPEDASGSASTAAGSGEADAAGAAAQPVNSAGPAAGASGGDVPATAADACTVPPTLTLDTVAGAMTTVTVDSPCHAGTVAELAYDGLRFAIRLDASGVGSLTAPGFQRSTEATVTLEGHEPIVFSLAFRDIERVERVAVAWRAASGLPLIALEFGARPEDEGHVRPEAPRSFEAVRREGGGWLSTYAPVEGKGQRIEVYSFWRRYAGQAGVIRLGLDAGRPGSGCAGGEVAGAEYEVLRSRGGRLEHARFGRIGALDCTRLAGGADRFIGDAVGDLIVRRR